MKKLLVLGANIEQIPLIKAAQKEGYEVIVCDYTNSNPGIPLADKHYQVSYLDQETVLDIAEKEQIDGIIGNSDPAMMIVAFISQRLGLVGNSPESIEKLLSKSLFRKLQKDCGLYCPRYLEAKDWSETEKALDDFIYPIMVKPGMCNGSQGVTKILSSDLRSHVKDAFQRCKQLSRNGSVIVEEFVEMPSLEIIEGDVFVNDDTILWNLFTTRRSVLAPMVPMTYIFPSLISSEETGKVKSTLKKLFQKAGVKHGFYNVEMFFTSKGDLFVIEINPRQGGHNIPNLIELHTGVDCYKLLVTTAVGDFTYYSSITRVEPATHFYTQHVVFSKYTGVFDGIVIAPEISKYVVNLQERNNISQVFRCTKGSDWLAYVTMCFPDKATQLEYSREKIEHYISVKVKDRQIPVVDCSLPYQIIYNFMTGDAYDFFVPKLLKAHRTVEDYAEQFANYGAIAYVTDSDNNLIGMVSGYVHNLRIPGWSYIAEVYVNSNHRRQGLGKELLSAYINYCKSLSLKGVWLNVTENNTPAQNLYKKAGFVFDRSYYENAYLKMDLSF